MLKRFLLTLLLFQVILSFSQVVINEIQPANLSTITDEDGDYEDWIELYNASTQAVDLGGYSLTDTPGQGNKWVFPSYPLEPDSTMILFASGKNRRPASDHYETAVYSTDYWHYFVGTSEPPSGWNTPAFDPSTWETGMGGIGYGDDDDSTIVPITISVYMRKVFSVLDTSTLSECLLAMDYDDGFIVYLNGVEIARINMSGNLPPFDKLADNGHEALMYQGLPPEFFSISKSLWKNIVHEGENVIAIQTHNNSASSSDLSSIPYLFFGLKDNSTQFGALPDWFSNGNIIQLHTDFKLNISGETLVLYTPDGLMADQLTWNFIRADHSWGRSPDGSLNGGYFSEPSPGFTNNQSICYQGYAPKPEMLPVAGLYQEGVEVQLVTGLPGSVIHYTLNGDIPQQDDPVYTTPLFIDTTSVVKARCFGPEGYMEGEYVTGTYIIADSLNLPVVSVSTDSLNLWDAATGIYINYWEEWEKESHIEYFEPNGQLGFELNAMIKIHGGWTRTLPQKSFTVKTNSRLDQSQIHYPLFPDKPIVDFQNFVLSNSGNDWLNTHFRDALMQKAVKTCEADWSDYLPAIVYLNGEYWGIYNIRELNNKEFVENNHGVPADSIDVIEMDGNPVAGDSQAFWEMYNFVTTYFTSDSANIQALRQWWDLENYADYMITNTYYVNNDWIGVWTNNVKLWRERKPGKQWRYILWDLDFGLGLSSSPYENKLADIMNPSSWTPHSAMFVSLLQNPEFRKYFITRYADLINTVFRPDKMIPLVEQMKEAIEEEMPAALLRWTGNSNLDDWYNNINNLTWFINERFPAARNNLQTVFNLASQSNLNIRVSPPGAGVIKVNTVIPDSYPWDGVYFGGVPVTLTAIPNPGYTFSEWAPDFYFPGGSTSSLISFDPYYPDSLIAVFLGSPMAAQISISEINYHSDSTHHCGDWIELHNYGNTVMDLSGWHVKDSVIYHDFCFPFGTTLEPNGYMVLAEDSLSFVSEYPGVEVFGKTGFGFGNKSETIYLSNYADEPVLTLTYLDTVPWPVCADGLGRTLELINPSGSINDPANWGCSCMGGSPGMPPGYCDESVIFSEINYHSADYADAGDWIEIHNLSNNKVDVGGWRFHDNNDQNLFVIEDSTSLNPGEYLVLCNDLEKFGSQFPYVENLQGPFAFGLSNEGEVVRLYNQAGKLMFSMIYDEEEPWPPDANGGHFTLELNNPSADFCNGLNWFAGCPGGSPGEAYFTPCTTGSDEDFPSLPVRISPNPASDHVIVHFAPREETSCSITIMDEIGRMIFHENHSFGPSDPSYSISLKSLKKGIYYLVLQCDNQEFSSNNKLVIIH